MSQEVDHWSSEAYQNSASFVPKLAGKILGWLDVKEDDVILDVGCGDGILNLQIAQILSKGKGAIHGIDSSNDMINAAKKAAASSTPSLSSICTFEVLDATSLLTHPTLPTSKFDKVFSNAAMHWILSPPHLRLPFFQGIHSALKPSGLFVFEMGGMGNVAEMRTALLSTVSRRVGWERTEEADPWFFPDEVWMKDMLENKMGEAGFKVERIEREYRPTMTDEGGVEGWVRLMGKQFFDVVGKEGEREREECIREVIEVVEKVCRSPGGGEWIGYVRLRALARKV